MRPSRTETAPATTASPSFIVRTVALRIRVEDIRAPLSFQCAFPPHADGGDVRLGYLAVLDGDGLGGDADGDLLRRDGADVEPDRRMHHAQGVGRDAFLAQRVEDPFDLRLAADEADVAERHRRERAQRVEVVT